MGCDIHSIGQVRKNGKWETVAVGIADEPRSYNTFAVLADVRNGRGFAGRKSGDTWPVISPPKGLPDDLEIKDSTPDSYGYIEADVLVPESLGLTDYNGKPRTTKWLGDHSFSHLTLLEIEDFIEKRFPKEYVTNGVIDKKQFEALEKDSTLPNSWCGGITGNKVTTVTAEEARNGVKHTHVQASWTRNALECNGITEYVEELRQLANEHNVSNEDIRIVFGFDS